MLRSQAKSVFRRAQTIAKIAIHALEFGVGRIKVGRNTLIGIRAELRGTISMGVSCRIENQVSVHAQNGHVTIGNFCSINHFTVLYGEGGIEIGNYVRIGAHCVFISANHRFDRLDVPIFEQGSTAKGIKIGDDVWIGAGTIILDGIKVGQGVVLGAGSVVTEDIPEFAVAVGVPAKVIRLRTEGQIQNVQNE